MAPKDGTSAASPTMNFLKKGAAKEVAPAIDEALGGEEASTATTTVAKAAEPKAKATVAAPKTKKAAEISPDLDLIVQTSHEVENLNAESAIGLAHKLIEDTEFSFFKLGGVLAAIQSNEWWQGQGYETFKQFIEEEFSMPYRKAMYFVAIYNGLIESGVPWEKVKNLGWTKLKELSSILTLDNMDGWIEKASSMTTIQLQEEIKNSATGPATEGAAEQTKVTTVQTMTFKLHEDQKEIVRAAVDKAKKDFNTEFDAVAIEHIATSYLEGGTGKAKTVTKEVIKEVPADLTATMKAMKWEDVLGVFEQVFPNVNLTIEE